MAKLKFQQFYTMFTKFSKREKMILYTASAVVVILLMDRLIINPVYSHISSLNRQISDKEKTVARNMMIVAKKDRINDELKRYDSFFHSAASDEENSMNLMKEIEAIANKSSIYIIDMKPSGVREDKDKMKKFLVAISCEGQMEQLMDFMYNVENASTLMSVDRYQITPKSQDTSIVSCTIVVSRMVI